MRKDKAECDLPDELRCSRSDNENWRCSKPRANNCRYCEHHRDILHANYQKRRKKADRPRDAVIGITKRCLSNKYKIGEPEVAETISVGGDILVLDDLTHILNKDTWIEQLTPAERSKLSVFLPNLEELDKTSVVESLLNGENLIFGNPATKWAESVCKGEQHPDVLLQKEQELRLSQKQYFENLYAFHKDFIASCKELKQICESCNEDNAKFRKKLKKQRARRAQRLWNKIE